jgi:hypothetical protein
MKLVYARRYKSYGATNPFLSLHNQSQHRQNNTLTLGVPHQSICLINIKMASNTVRNSNHLMQHLKIHLMKSIFPLTIIYSVLCNGVRGGRRSKGCGPAGATCTLCANEFLPRVEVPCITLIDGEPCGERGHSGEKCPRCKSTFKLQ